MGGGAAAVAAPGLGHQQAGTPQSNGIGLVAHRRSRENQPSVLLLRLGYSPLGQLLQICLVIAHHSGKLDQLAVKVGLALSYLRDDPVPHPIACVLHIPVGAVLHPRQALGAEVLLNFRSGGGQQGADNVVPHRGDTRQAPQAGAPHQMQEHRFGIVVRVVGGGNHRTVQLSGGPLKKIVSHLPGGFLNALAGPGRLCGHVPPADDQLHTGQGLGYA